jgi:hypothetical protein
VLLSREHVSVDGTLTEVLAPGPGKRMDRRAAGGGNPAVDFHGEKRSLDSHESKMDKDAFSSRTARAWNRSWLISGIS